MHDLDHFIYTGSTGANYLLNVNQAGVWTSAGAVYLAFDQSANRLYFPDGSFWAMGCTSALTEPDAGALYPTLMQDTNGNQIIVGYLPGRGRNGRFRRESPRRRTSAACREW